MNEIHTRARQKGAKSSTAPKSIQQLQSQVLSSAPFTTIQFVDTNPVSAWVDADARVGSIRVQMKGNVPSDLKVYVSENFSAVNDKNATWTFDKQTVFSILPREQRILNPKKQTDKDAKKFQQLYFLFVTEKPDSSFKVQVNFPEEEEQERRRQLASD